MIPGLLIVFNICVVNIRSQSLSCVLSGRINTWQNELPTAQIYLAVDLLFYLLLDLEVVSNLIFHHWLG